MNSINRSSILVSVIVPAYNHEHFVQKTVNSILSQTYPNIELIIINDGSVDCTHARIVELKSECISRCRHFTYIASENKGVASALNLGITRARGKYVFLIASDDWSEPHTIETLLDRLEGKGGCYIMACGEADFIDAQGNRIYLNPTGRILREPKPISYSTLVAFQTRKRRDFNYLTTSFGSYTTLLAGNYIPGGNLVLRDAMIKAGLYDSHHRLEDLEMWLKLSKLGKFTFVKETLLHYRLHGGNTFSAKKTALIKEIIELLLREKTYCVTHGHLSLWKKIFAYSILSNAGILSRSDFLRLKDHIGWIDFLAYGALACLEAGSKRLKQFQHNHPSVGCSI